MRYPPSRHPRPRSPAFIRRDMKPRVRPSELLVAALIFTAIYLQRGGQGMVKSTGDSLGSQFSTTQKWTQETKTTSTETAASVATNQKTNYNQTLTEP